MKKILFFVLALALTGVGLGFADVQIDEGQSHGTAPVKYFIARVGSNQIVSKDRVVVYDTTSDDGVTVRMTTTSLDRLVAGITMEAITGVSDDTVTNNRGNWGRVQTWGYHSGAVPKAVGDQTTVGAAFCTSSLQGYVAPCPILASKDNTVVAGSAFDATAEAADTTGIELFVDTD